MLWTIFSSEIITRSRPRPINNPTSLLVWRPHRQPRWSRAVNHEKRSISSIFLPSETIRAGEASDRRRHVREVSPRDVPPKQGTGRPDDIPFFRASSDAIFAPVNYILSMPSKKVCELATAALNVWVHAPESSMNIIKETAQLLHDACIVIDDVQDNSPIRRGKPAVHVVFGHAQALQAANLMTVQAMQAVRKLRNPTTIDILLEEVSNLHLGQSLDIHWRFELKCPSEKEYLNMVDSKTGSFFRVISRLLRAEAERDGADSLDHVTTLLGRFYQIRDDYMNLQSTLYASQKGSCEDLDEGKFSYPIIHCLTNSPAHRSCIIGMFRQRPTFSGPDAQPLSARAKDMILSCLEESGSLDATLEVVNELKARLDSEIDKIEKATGIENHLLRMLLRKLSPVVNRENSL